MKKTNKAKMVLKAAVVIVVALAFILPSSAVITNSTTETKKNSIYDTYTTTRLAINKVLPKQNTLVAGADVLVSSDNPDQDDEKPKMTMNKDGTIVVTYEKENDLSSRVIPVAYSDDDGQTWTIQFEFDSAQFQEGSGILESPDIKYSPKAEQFFWEAIDPLAEMYNEELSWIPGDIANAQTAVWYGISGQDAQDYLQGALTYVGEWLVAFSLETNYEIIDCPGLGYMYYDEGSESVLFPNEVDPGWAAGYYYDGQSVLETAPAIEPELATGKDRIYMVMESDKGEYKNISFKATVTDLDPDSETFLYTSGGGPSGMDKYADIEVWPMKQEYLAFNATDPDVSAKGNTVAVVYTQGGDVKCSASTNDGDDWTVTTTVATGAGYPSVYVTADKIYVAYVQDGNLSLVDSDDDGATWNTPVQINDQDGTVVAEPGTVDIGPLGVIWTDSRNGESDVYFEFKEIDPPIPEPKLELTINSGWGLGVSAVVKNIGEAVATDVEWTLKVLGGILGLINVEVTDTEASLAVGAELPISSGVFFGLGTIEIAVSAECAEEFSATGNTDGTQLIIFTKVN